jgi:hypothetical protein
LQLLAASLSTYICMGGHFSRLIPTLRQPLKRSCNFNRSDLTVLLIQNAKTLKSIVIIIFLSISVSVYGQTIEGKVIDGTRNEIINFTSVQLLDSSAMTTEGSVITDEDGKFKFTNVSSGVYCIRIMAISYKDTTFCDIKVSGDTTLKLDIHRFCQYDVSLIDKTCPVCRKQDKVIPIVYGLLNSDKGNGKTFKLGGCNISYCDPHWYCKRDKTEF